jgi:phosphoribosylaminoimidazole-succinocarboxamide synthase
MINELPIVKKHYQGKVRDIYDLGTELLVVTSDRISAFDVVFPNIIPNKGKILNQISVSFFKTTGHIIPNHFITDIVEEYPVELHPFKEELEDRSMLVKKTRVVPFECIVRGYITGSAWSEYKSRGTVNNTIIAEDMQESQRFPKPIFTPSTKAEEGHDINISYAELLDRIDKNLAEQLRDKSIELYKFGADMLKTKGILLADTKFEFGTLDGKLYLIDEMLTPDSSRFWDIEEYEVGKTPKSYDKQYIRDYISATGWDKKPPAPELPEDIITRTYEKYYTAYKSIAGGQAKEWRTE